MAAKLLPQVVADAFVKQYYAILSKCPENVHKFYQDPSLLGWPGADGIMTPVTTLTGINEKIMSTDYKNCTVEIKTTDAQESLDGAFIIAVTGSSTGKDDVKRNFSQTFFLAKQENGFFVLNDILRFFDVCEPIIETAAKDDVINDQPAPAASQDEVTRDIPDSPKSLHAKAVVENAKVDEDSVPALKKPVAKVASCNPPAASVASSNPPDASLEKTRPIVAPASNVNEDTKKITYASMVAKEARPPSPKTTLVSSNAQPIASPKAKSSARLGEGAPKVSTPSRATSQAPPASSKVAPKMATPSNGAPDSGAYANAKGIYIGRLPYDITKHGMVEVFKQFGPVRRNADTIQIRRYDDGFCCGFLEFESAESARRAVEARHIDFGDVDAYIVYKKSTYNRGNRSPSRIGVRNGEATGNEKLKSENRAGYKKRVGKSPRRA